MFETNPFYIFQTKMKKLRSCSVVVSTSTGRDDLVCDICFDPITTNGHVTGSAMKSCDHWFCHNCWCHHLVARVMQGDLMPSCPVSTKCLNALNFIYHL